MWWIILLLCLCFCHSAVAEQKSLQDLEYRVFPRRAEAEAAVLEWGHSAVISALDASVAVFGPQTTQAALLEVEAAPVLASPVNGLSESDKEALKAGEPLKLPPLDNEDEVVGNLVVMTNAGGLTGVQMAQIAQKSGAAALLVVNVDDKRPDDIYRLPATAGADEIDIPVVMISTNSANVLTTATVEPEMKRSQIVNNGMPDRVRLYAGGDRPFFEDVESSQPTVYLIHDLLTSAECDALIAQAEPRLEPFVQDDVLQHSTGAAQSNKVDRVTLWQGLLQFPAQKTIEERIEQVTAFPANHFSDFVVDRFQAGSYVQPSYDIFDNRLVPVASISIFLSDAPTNGGGEIVYPSTASDDPVKVVPRKGLAVVHHNTDERGQFDTSSQHAVLPLKDGPYYIAHKYIYMEPISYARRLALPALALPFGGKLPGVVLQLHEYMVGQFGAETGEDYFNKVCVFVPLLIVLLIAQAIADRVRAKPAKKEKHKASEKKKN